MYEINDQMVPIINNGVKARQEAYGLLIVSKRTPILNLNEDSAILWNSIDGTKSIHAIVSSMNNGISSAEDAEKNRKIIMDFYKSCYELGLISFK